MPFKTRLGALRYNNRMEKLWANVRKLENERLARGERPNTNLTEPSGLVCPRCNREVHPWPLVRRDACSPKDWYLCIRQADDVMTDIAKRESA